MKPMMLWAVVIELSLFSSAVHAAITVESARYGSQNVGRDVTEIVQRFIVEGELRVNCDNSSLGGDPIFGEVKFLTVRYRSNKGEYTIKVQEGGSLTLNAGSAFGVPERTDLNSDDAKADDTLSQNTNAQLPKYLGTMTIGGKTFTNVKVTSVDPAGVRVFHDSGIASIAFEHLSDELQKIFGFTAEGAAAYRRIQSEKAAAASSAAQALRDAKARDFERENILREEAKSNEMQQKREGFAEKLERRESSSLARREIAVDEREKKAIVASRNATLAEIRAIENEVMALRRSINGINVLTSTGRQFVASVNANIMAKQRVLEAKRTLFNAQMSIRP